MLGKNFLLPLCQSTIVWMIPFFNALKSDGKIAFDCSYLRPERNAKPTRPFFALYSRFFCAWSG